MVGKNDSSANRITNSCFDSTVYTGSFCGDEVATVDNCMGISTVDFETGKACYYLNDEVTDGTQVWYQTLLEDAYPVWDKTHKTVYESGVKYCDNTVAEGEISYANEVGVSTTIHKRIVQVAAVESTCTKSGYEVCYQCEGCRQYFSDAVGKKSLAERPTMAKKEHDYGTDGKYIGCGLNEITGTLIDSGVYDDTLTWGIYDTDGDDIGDALVCSGTGVLPAYYEAPWSIYFIKTADVSDVTSLAGGAFYGCSSLQTVVLSEQLESIPNGCFNGCENLKSIDIPNKVKSIGESAFGWCTGLKEIELPDGLETIGTSAFVLCSVLEEMTIPAEVKTINANAFSNCTALKTVYIEGSVSEIGESAFSNCTSLSELEFPTSVESIGESAFSSCTSLSELELPESVERIGTSAFRDCTGLKKVVLSSDALSSDEVFADCSGIIEFYYPQNVEITEDVNAVMMSYVIKEVESESGEETVSVTVESVPEGVGSILLPERVGGKKIASVSYADSIDRTAFGAYRSIVITEQPKDMVLPLDYEEPATLSIGLETDSGSLNGISYCWIAADESNEIFAGDTKECVIETGRSAGVNWYYCIISGANFKIISNQAEVAIGRLPSAITVESGKENVALKCGDTNIALEGISKTGDGTLVYTVTEGNDVISVSEDGKVTALKEGTATITVSMAATDSYARAESKKITVTVEKAKQEGTEDQPGSSGNQDTPEQPDTSGTQDTPKQPDTPGSQDTSGQPDTSGQSTTVQPAAKGTKITEEKTGATYQVTSADSTSPAVEYTAPKKGVKGTVTIPATVNVDGVEYKVTSIAKNAFKKNTKITKVTIGNNVETIGKEAFSGCTKLKTLTIGANVTTISDKAFYKCSALTKVTIPAKVKKIGKSAFEGCKKLKTITIKTTSLTNKSVGAKAFKGIKSNATIKVPKSKLKAYKTLLVKKGVSKKAKIKK